MTKNMFTVFDNVSKLYSPPFLEVNNGSAMRGLQDIMQRDPNNPWTKFPDNYTLINIGLYDDENGVCEPANHQTVAELISIKLPTDMEKE